MVSYNSPFSLSLSTQHICIILLSLYIFSIPTNDYFISLNSNIFKKKLLPFTIIHIFIFYIQSQKNILYVHMFHVMAFPCTKEWWMTIEVKPIITVLQLSTNKAKTSKIFIYCEYSIKLSLFTSHSCYIYIPKKIPQKNQYHRTHKQRSFTCMMYEFTQKIHRYYLVFCVVDKFPQKRLHAHLNRNV